ncbi:Dyp-type peroxidase [Cystobacter fuscus]|uniref:Dyp-type peroxidase n=1 Tax=Cystobacter fuscus TaxID=43 RepID=UPI002B2E61AD|nr:peroxidase [Cystobacter fuscus]
MALMKKQLDWHDIQAIVFAGYGDLPRARYAFLRVKHPERAKAWLRELSEQVTTMKQLQGAKAEGQRKDHAVHVAFTEKGLAALGLPREVRESFLPEFVEGQTSAHRARALGDTGASAPHKWCFGGPVREGEEDKEIHLVLMLFTHGDEQHLEEMESLHARHRERYAAGLGEVFVQDACLRRMDGEEGTQNGFKEAFGFRDGITQPTIEGTPAKPGQTPPIKAGEFILGYENAYGQLPSSPTVSAEQDSRGLLPALEGSSRKDLGCNGTYLVLRKLRQDVESFEHFLHEHSRDPEDPQGDAHRRELLAAKLMGRWRSGAPLSLCPARDDKELGRDTTRNNDFLYGNDPHGLRCPMASHIRRSNPRDTLIPDSSKTSLKVSDRRQLIRRGRPYQDSNGEQGMMFVALNANIQRQFEFIQQSWMNNPKFTGLYDSRDPIAGNNHDPELEGSRAENYAVSIPAEPVRQRITGVPRFVHVRGGAYFFLPGIQALRFLAS